MIRNGIGSGRARRARIAKTGNLARAVLAGLASLLLAAQVVTGAEGPALRGVVNVNTATIVELQLLPGVGEARAAAIISTRKSRGGFKSVEELVEVRGIGDALLENLRPFVRLSGKTTARIM